MFTEVTVANQNDNNVKLTSLSIGDFFYSQNDKLCVYLGACIHKSWNDDFNAVNIMNGDRYLFDVHDKVTPVKHVRIETEY